MLTRVFCNQPDVLKSNPLLEIPAEDPNSINYNGEFSKVNELISSKSTRVLSHNTRCYFYCWTTYCTTFPFAAAKLIYNESLDFQSEVFKTQYFFERASINWRVSATKRSDIKEVHKISSILIYAFKLDT